MYSREFLLAVALFASVSLRAADTTPPAIQSAFPAASTTISNLTQVTVTFSEPITGITFEDLLINGAASAVGMSGSNAVYTFFLEAQPLYGTVQIGLDTNHQIFDLAMPPNRFDATAPASSWQYNLVDTIPPTVASVTPLGGVTIRQLTQIDVQFSELVAGLDASDLLVNGVPAGQLTSLGGARYRFLFPQPASGSVQLSWAVNHGIHDFAIAPNAFAGGTWAYTLNPAFGLASVRINEFLASSINPNGLKDENNELQDWIELYNFGAVAVNLAGYSLTDDRDDPGKWTFPATNIGPGQYLVVFASEKNRKAPAAGNRFHTSFRLNPFGDYLALFNADSPRVALTEFAPEYPEQRNDFSYGYDTSNVLKYFGAPTPGAANGTSGITGVAPPPHFNVNRGLFNSPFTLLLNSSLPGAVLRYTTDGSEPSGTNGTVYSLPLQITNTAMIRAAAFKTNMLPSLAATHTYIFPDGVLRQPASPPGFPTGATIMGGYPSDYEMDPEIVTNTAYTALLKPALRALPSLSIVMNVEDMFGTNNGLYTHSSDSQTLYRGPAWERACSAEFILTNGETGFQVNCGIQIQGNASRNPQKQPKHPFRILFKGAWGPASLDYQVFPDSPLTSFDSVVLRSDFNNAWTHWDSAQRTRGSRIRDAWSKDTFRAMGGLAGHTRHFHLYINGLYWGLYEFSEKADANYAAAYLGGKQADYDAIASKPTQAVDGDMQAYNAMVAISNLGDINQYNLMLTYLDMPAFIDYMLIEFYGANLDWGLDGNWNAVRRRSTDGRFKYILWDAERLIEDPADNRVSVTTDLPSGLHAKLIASPEYKLAFADRVQKHMFNGGALTTNVMMGRWLARAASIDPAIVAESARWGDYRRDVSQSGANAPYALYARSNYWLPEVNRIATNYFPSRQGIFMSQLTGAGLYPSVPAPVFNQQGGFVPRGFNLAMTLTPPSTTYFTTDGSDPRTFGSGAVSPSAQTYASPVSLTNSVVVKARILSGGVWSALNEATFTVDALGSPLRITEIMYAPIGGDAYEFIEVQNVSSATFDAGSFSIDGAGYVFPPITLLGPGQAVVLASDSSPVNWSNRYPGITVFGWFSGKLDDGGEKLAIKNAAGQTLWSVDYDAQHGWPATAAGGGASLEIIDVFGDPDDAANWRASSIANGTPGTVTPPPPQGSVVINEVMAENISSVNNGGAYPDWIELRNNGGTPVSLTGWSLTDDSNPRKFVFGAGVNIAPGGHLVIWCDTNSAAPGMHTQFALRRSGDGVYLFDANTNRMDAVGFGLQLADFSIGRSPNGTGSWTLTQPTPGSANAAVTLAAASNLSINEWLANAAPGADDWVEIYNRTASPISLRGLYLATSNSLFRLTALSFIAPGGFMLFHADENPGADHVDFKLNADGDAIALYDGVGALIERVSFGPQAQGVTQGRVPNGGAAITNFPASASPAAGNYLVTYTGPLLNEILAVNHAAVTNAAGRTADFIELRNTNAVAFDLSGMRLGKDPADPSPWIFPGGVGIAGNGHLVVWFDNELPATTNAGPFLNTGRSLDAEAGGVWFFNSAGQPVDSVAFGFQVADLSIGRSVFGGSWSLLAAPTPGSANSTVATLGSPALLRLNEWAANSNSGDDWFELYNGSTSPVDLSGLFLSDSPAATSLTESGIAPLSFVGAKGFVRFYADGHPSNGRNHVNFSLDGDGESLQIYSSTLGVIDVVYFGSQPASGSQGRLPDGATNIVNFPLTPTPAESNFLPLPNCVINEVLAHADAPLEDAIEIANLTGTAVNVGGWYLSDNQSDFKKYKIVNGTLLPAAGFLVFYENQLNGGSGSLVPFTLDSLRGEEAWLSQADNAGNLTGYRAVAKFGASANGVAFGRHITSVGADFPAESQRSLNAANTAPLVGPLVINEIMHHPPDFGGAENVSDEYIEIYNVTSASVPLYDPAAATNTWRLRGGVTFNFPQGASMSSHSYLLVVSFDPVANPAMTASFRGYYGLASTVPIHGPYLGHLDDQGEAIELQKPDAPAGGFVPYPIADLVHYADAYPWPPGADGTGLSFQRRRPVEYGNDPVNWRAEAPTPGRANVGGSTFVDSDGDGMPDSYEQANSFDPFNSGDAGSDADGDGRSNYQEFLDGTDPRNASSHLDAPSITSQPQSRVVLLGSNTTFAVTATGTAPLRFQWRLNSVLISGGTNDSITISNAQSANAGIYDVTVLNAAGFALSQGASLILNQPPVITQQPVSQSVVPGTNVTFTVAATGSGSVTYQWLFNGAILSGATNGTLMIPSVTLGSEGDYAALVMDAVATISSQTARLTVKVPPVILIPPIGQTNALGGTATYTVHCSGSVPMTFIWRRGSTPVATNVLFTTNDTFTLTNLQFSDSNTFRLIITNSGSISVNGTNVTFVNAVWPVTAITTQPTNRTVDVGGATSFSVGASSFNLSYQWRRNGVNLPDATNATLNLTNIQGSQTGGYSVLVTNVVGSVLSQTAILTLTGQPILTEPEYLSNGTMRFKLLGNSNQSYFIEVSTNLVDWPTLTNLLATNALTPFLDGTNPGITNRFYRARLAP
ncbi:MAG: hypothetical protein QOF48_2033 [Verrucomicrobiota bacterium]